MNAAQQNLYFFEWGRVREHLRARGIDPKQADAKRHELHRRALGRDKSSKDLTNAELDKVIAAFRALVDGADLDAQLRQLESPEYLRQRLVDRAKRAAGSFITAGDAAVMRYLDGTAERMFGVTFGNLDHGQEGNPQLRKVMGAIERTARVRRKKGDPF